jgi:uncharacterized protein HemY
MPNRIEAIQKMLVQNPKDVFLHYSLGMEYASEGRHGDAVEEFLRCIEVEEDYLAAYVEAGKCLRAAARREEARGMMAAALERAVNQGERHIADFVKQQLDAMADPRGA